jgi:hypothetical protein
MASDTASFINGFTLAIRWVKKAERKKLQADRSLLLSVSLQFYTSAFQVFVIFVLSEIMVEHIHPAVFDHIHSRIFHDFPDLRFVLTMIALSFASLAHGFGMVGAFYSHGQAIGKEPCTPLAKQGSFFFDLMDIKEPEGKRRLFSIMVLTAVDPHKFHQRLNIGSFRF